MPRGRPSKDKGVYVKGVYERPASSGNWCARYRVGDVWVRKSFGNDRDAAISYVEKARTIKRSGEGQLPTTAKKPVLTFLEETRHIKGIKLGQLCDELKKHIAANPRHYKDQVNPPRRLDRIKRELGDERAESLQPPDICKWLNGLGLADASWNRYKAMLSAVYTYAKEQGILKVNPVRDVKQKRLNNGVIRFLRPEEEKRIRLAIQTRIDTCEVEYHKRMIHHLAEFEIALKTGMRKGEQYGLTWRDVDFRRGEIVLTETKNGSPRVIPMLPEVVQAFKTLKKLDLSRKPRANNRPNQSPADSCFALGDPKKWWASVLKEAKVHNFRWHDLRHTFCSRLAQKGKSLKVIQELAGHKTIAMAARYSHMDQSTLRSALEDTFAA